jgi:hypothetical protein
MVLTTLAGDRQGQRGQQDWWEGGEITNLTLGMGKFVSRTHSSVQGCRNGNNFIPNPKKEKKSVVYLGISYY